MDDQQIRTRICAGEAYLGIEFGSTRIKSVLVDEKANVLASGSHAWENRLESGVWTYSLEDIHQGLRDCYASLCANVKARYGTELRRVAAMGVSAMMHGYMPFDARGNLLVPFRTWRNTITGEAAAILSERFRFNIPQRWSAAHLYQAILNREEHVQDIAFLTTLSGYIHWKLTGEKVLGTGDASGMFPIGADAGSYDEAILASFDALCAEGGHALPWKVADILPKPLPAGAQAGVLSESGARFLDPSGTLEAGVPFCPPEGDAGTGMVATCSVRRRGGNVSAGTSIFAMAVLEKPLTRYYPQIDMVTTPAGDPVAMVHCNNCSSDLDAWVRLFGETLAAFGADVGTDTLYTTLFNTALKGDADCGGLLAYNYFSGEHVTGFDEGRPLFVRRSESAFTLANFMRVQLYTALASLKSGMGILLDEEKVQLESMTGHGGFFKVEGVGARMLAAALGAPVRVMETAGEGGPWGMAILAAYAASGAKQSLADYLDTVVFADAKSSTVEPAAQDAEGFARFMERYMKGLAIERAAVEAL